MDDARIALLENSIKALSESNRLLTYQMQQQGESMSDLSKTLHEVRDAVMRLESVESTRNYPGQISKIKDDIDHLDQRIRSLERAVTTSDAQKNLVGWIVQNWPSLLAIVGTGIVCFKLFVKQS